MISQHPKPGEILGDGCLDTSWVLSVQIRLQTSAFDNPDPVPEPPLAPLVLT
tara:strand:- start:93 stop:248 length:156 start_codon:yes stop_codon:yes gene_type:complete